jgi:hypothetical protein
MANLRAEIENGRMRSEAHYAVEREGFDAARKEGRLSPEEEKAKLESLAGLEAGLKELRKHRLPTEGELRRHFRGPPLAFPTNSD